MNIYYNLKLEDIKERMDSLSKFYEKFRKYFRSKTREVSSQGIEIGLSKKTFKLLRLIIRGWVVS